MELKKKKNQINSKHFRFVVIYFRFFLTIKVSLIKSWAIFTFEFLNFKEPTRTNLLPTRNHSQSLRSKHYNKYFPNAMTDT